MERVLRAKFCATPVAQSLLLSTGQKRLVEDSPVDNVWGSGRNNDGQNLLGKALMKLRDELRTSILKDFLVEELERLDEEDLANIEPPPSRKLVHRVLLFIIENLVLLVGKNYSIDMGFFA